MKTLVQLVGLVLLVVFVKAAFFGSDQFQRHAVVEVAGSTSPCGVGEPLASQTVAVTGSADVLLSPEAGAKKLRNDKASEILGSEQTHSIDNTTSVRTLCRSGEYTKVQVVEPDWLTHVVGWVPSSALRGIETSASGKRKYVEEDIYWDGETRARKPEIMQKITQIVESEPGCSTIDTGTITRSPSKSKPSDPVFFVTCTGASQPFNVWFRLDGSAPFR